MSAPPSTKRVARVLSIAGDGARTAVAAHVLAELEWRTGQPVHRLFHLIVGEGAGAVLAMLLTLRGAGGRVLPLDAEAAGIAIEESLPDFNPPRSWLSQVLTRLTSEPVDRRARANLSLTGAEGLLGAANLSSALTDLAIPAFDTANIRPFLFRSWKAQGLYLSDQEGSGRFDFRGSDIAAAALRHPLEVGHNGSIQARSRAEFRLSGGGALAPDPVSLAALQARQLYRRANVIQTVSLSFGSLTPVKGAPDWAQAGQRALSQIIARGMAEQVLSLNLPTQDAEGPVPTHVLQRQMRTLARRFLQDGERHGFSALTEEYSNHPKLPHTAIRTPQSLAPATRASLVPRFAT